MNPDAAPRPAAAASAPFNIRVDRALTHPQVIALLEEHLAGMRAASPPECVFALDLNGLRRPEITFLTAWRLPADGPYSFAENGIVLEPADRQTTPEMVAKEFQCQRVLPTGYARVSLETGSTPPFDAAIAMYRRFGFVECGPFAEYREDPFSRFMTIELG